MKNKIKRIPWNKGLHVYLGGKRFEKGNKTWNTGLTKETNKTLMLVSQRMSKKKVELVCQECGNTYLVRPYRKNISKYCSKQCHARAVIAGKYPPEIAWNKGLRVPQLAGAKNGHWKGGIATKLINWRIEVFKRDKYTCQISGKVGGRLNAHHILPCRICTELGVDKYKYDIENGVTLSRECHKKMVGREFLYIPKFLGI